MPPEMVFGGDDVGGRAVAAPEQRAGARPAKRSVAFGGLMLFTFVLFVAPQNFVPGLQALMVAKLAMGIAIVAYLANRNATGRPLTLVAPPVRWALAFTAIAILTIPLGFWPGGSVSVFLDLFGKSLVVFVLIANVVDTPRRARLLISSMVLWGAVLALIAISQYRSGTLDPTGERITGFESQLAANPNDLALTLNILLALALGLLPTVRPRGRRVLVIGAMALMVAGIVASYSRGGFLTLCVLGALWTVRSVRERGVLALAGVALAVVALGVVAPETYMSRLATITDSKADTTGSSEERWESMKDAVGLIAERPLFGVGVGNSRHVLVARGGGDREAHNAYLKVGAEMGLGGGIVYLILVVSTWLAARSARRRLLRRPGYRDLAALAGGVELSVVVFAVGAFFAPVPYHFYFYYPAGLAVAVSALAARAAAAARPAAREA
jgi:putative inorganic carbon (HCO3(-)) transporter